MRRHRIESVAPAVFMDVAVARDDPEVYVTVFRFCTDFVPGFALLPDHAFYARRLAGYTGQRGGAAMA